MRRDSAARTIGVLRPSERDRPWRGASGGGGRWSRHAWAWAVVVLVPPRVGVGVGVGAHTPGARVGLGACSANPNTFTGDLDILGDDVILR